MEDRNSITYGLTYGALTAFSGWSYMQCSDLKYARIAFGLYAANGVVGVIDFLLPRRNDTVKRLLDTISRCSRPFYLPLLAAEAILFAGFEEKYSYCFLVFPAVYLVLTELLKKHIDSGTLDLSNVFSAISVGYSGYVKEDLYGGVCAILGLVTFIGRYPYNSFEYFLLISATSLAAVQFFKQVF